MAESQVEDGVIGLIWVDAGNGKKIKTIPIIGTLGSDWAPISMTDVMGVMSLNTNITGGVVSGTFQQSGLTKQGRVTMLTIDSTTWYEAPASALSDRNNIEIQNPSTSASNIVWNYDNTAPATAGFQVPPGASRSLAITGSIPVYIRMVSGSATAVVEELA